MVKGMVFPSQCVFLRESMIDFSVVVGHLAISSKLGVGVCRIGVNY